MKGKLIWVTGYFGSGKTTLVRTILNNVENLKYMKTYTTREPREGETNSNFGEYYFINTDDYNKRKSTSGRWDHTVIGTDFYGVDTDTINHELSTGINFVCNVVPNLDLLQKMKKFYEISPIIVWIDTPLSVANERLRLTRKERIKHLLQTPETRKIFCEIANYVFTPENKLEIDILTFKGLISKIIDRHVV